MHKLKPVLIAAFVFTCTSASAQTNIKGWHLMDLQKDSFNGISLEEAYNFLTGRNYKQVIVAVIDSGVDTTHSALKNNLWRNPDEIPGNGIDDDGNGYVDDIYGWNFLGNKNGANLKKDIDERTRVYYRYKENFSEKYINEDSLNIEEKWLYSEWKKAAKQMHVNNDDQMQVMFLEVAYKTLKKHDDILKQEMDRTEYTTDELEKLAPKTQKGKQAKMGYITCIKLLGVDGGETNTAVISELKDYIDGKKQSADEKSHKPPDYRAQIINDDYFNINDKFYGNNDVMGPNPMHGTHVSGIIAAQKNKENGISGIADHVKVMMIRAVPDGDEYDKDVALAIKYAVDNGAKVINMSFGKSFSPEKKWVDEAVRYAQLHDVLLIHAAGNESANVDSTDNFPNADLIEFNSNASNFITVGASGDAHVADGNLIADFTNYGSTNVDVFAPGVKIYSTLPGGNRYGFLNGTSFSAPIVAGIAALIRSYFPGLSAEQVKYAIEKSAVRLTDTSLYLTEPGTGRKVKMNELCRTSGFVNAEAAVELAATLKPNIVELRNVPDKLPEASFKNSKEKQN